MKRLFLAMALMVVAILLADTPYAAEYSMTLNVGKGQHSQITDNQVSIFAAVDDLYEGVGVYGSIGIGDYDEPDSPGHVYDMDSVVYKGGLTWGMPLGFVLHTGYAYTYSDYSWYDYNDASTHQVRSHEYGYDVGVRYMFEGNGTLGIGYDNSTETAYLMAGFHI